MPQQNHRVGAGQAQRTYSERKKRATAEAYIRYRAEAVETTADGPSPTVPAAAAVAPLAGTKGRGGSLWRGHSAQ